MSGNDIDRTLADWFQTDALAQAPADGVERALVGARRRSPRPAWLAGPGSHWVGDSVRPSLGAATLGRIGLRTSTAVLLLLLVLALVAGAVLVGTRLIQPAPARLGIFEPVAGKILSGGWTVDPVAVDPSTPSRSTVLDLGPQKVLPVAWSSDGTRLLFMREDPADETFPYARHLFILNADGTETQLNTEAMEMWGATIAPDGSRVVFAAAADDGQDRAPILFTIDSDGGEPVPFATGSSPTFSPDGKRIAYIKRSQGPGMAQIWVADADGSDAHEIDGPDWSLSPGSFDELTWSPVGDRLALVDSLGASISTVAPDGSDFTTVISGGLGPVWSPDGSQIAYTPRRSEVPPGELTGWWVRHHREYVPSGLAIADADGSNVRELGVGASGPWHPGVSAIDEPVPSPATTETAPETIEAGLVLYLDSWRDDRSEVAVYADGRVISAVAGDSYVEQRLTPEGVERLRSSALSTGLFQRDLLATAIGDLVAGTDVVGSGYIKLVRGDRPVIVAWGRTPEADVSGHGVDDRWVRASSAQAVDITELDRFLRDPTTWGLADDMYVQREITPFVPSHFWISWDRGTPDWSELPSPARELVTRFMDGCSNISLDQAREIAQVLTQAGVRTDYDDRLGLSFSLPSSFVHTHPSLPHDVGDFCDE